MVRRASAFFLLVLAALLPLRPLVVQAQILNSLPACCRPHGVHHCMMMEKADVGFLSLAIVTKPACPLWKLTVPPVTTVRAVAPFVFTSQFAALGTVAVSDLDPHFTAPTLSRPARAPPTASSTLLI